LNLSKAIIFMLCVNLGAWMTVQVGAVGGIPINVENTADTLQEDVEGLMESNPANLVTLMTGYVWSAMQFIWNLFSWTFLGLPLFLAQLNLPEVITYPLGIIWAAVWAIGIAEFLRGMKFG